MPESFDSTITHPLEGRSIQVPFTALDGVWTPPKVETCKRLIRAYKTTVAQGPNAIKSIQDDHHWAHLIRANFGEMLTHIDNDDAGRLSHYLTHFGRDYVGFGGVTTGVDGYNHWDQSPASVAFTYFDKLLNLAEALGVLPVENPEQGEGGNWGKNIRLTPDEVAALITQELGISIAPPAGIIPVAGIATNQGVVHYRHLNALYMAARIRGLTTGADRIAEFGAGLGLVAFYLRKLGRVDTTLFDLPTTNIFSAFFLIGALGEDAVCLEGEQSYDHRIKVRAFWNCTEASDRHFKLIANQDSFPEISRAYFNAYIEQIKRTSSRYFLSINHEVGDRIDALNVSKILSAESDLTRISRSPYWMRKGYAEELYQVPYE